VRLFPTHGGYPLAHFCSLCIALPFSHLFGGYPVAISFFKPRCAFLPLAWGYPDKCHDFGADKGFSHVSGGYPCSCKKSCKMLFTYDQKG